MIIAAVLIKIRPKLPEGAAFFLYLVLFSVLRFFLFFVRGNVPEVLLGLKKRAVDSAGNSCGRTAGPSTQRLSKAGCFGQVMNQERCGCAFRLVYGIWFESRMNL